MAPLFGLIVTTNSPVHAATVLDHCPFAIHYAFRVRCSPRIVLDHCTLNRCPLFSIIARTSVPNIVRFARSLFKQFLVFRSSRRERNVNRRKSIFSMFKGIFFFDTFLPSPVTSYNTGSTIEVERKWSGKLNYECKCINMRAILDAIRDPRLSREMRTTFFQPTACCNLNLSNDLVPITFPHPIFYPFN